MNSGDRIQVTMHDTPQGLRTDLVDLDTGQRGSMTASPANGFAQLKYDPTGSSCQEIPYAFHPMYSTSSEKTRVIWAAHSNAIGFTDEIGHFQNCNGAAVPATSFGVDARQPDQLPATNTEDGRRGRRRRRRLLLPGNGSPRSSRYKAVPTPTPGSTAPPTTPGVADGSRLHPTPIQFTSPMTGPGYPSVTSGPPSKRTSHGSRRAPGHTCDRTTGAGCTLIPHDDEGRRHSSIRTSPSPRPTAIAMAAGPAWWRLRLAVRSRAAADHHRLRQERRVREPAGQPIPGVWRPRHDAAVDQRLPERVLAQPVSGRRAETTADRGLKPPTVAGGAADARRPGRSGRALDDGVEQLSSAVTTRDSGCIVRRGRVEIAEPGTGAMRRSLPRRILHRFCRTGVPSAGAE